jgi:DNA uptake protein ComE-like DNA-binding protein
MAIIDYRPKRSVFRRLADPLQVCGIGPKKLPEMLDRVTLR